MKIENWCKVNYANKEIWDRKLPNSKSKDKQEENLGSSLGKLRKKLKQYKGMELEEVEDEEDRRVLEIIRRLDKEYGMGDALKNALRIENWCKKNYGDKQICDRRLPKKTSEDEEESGLGKDLNNLRTKLKKYEEMKIEEVEDEEDRRCLEIIRRLDEEYNPKKKGRTVKEIAEASISSLTDIEMSDREDKELKALVEKTKEGGIKLDEQS